MAERLPTTFTRPPVELPYFDFVLGELEAGNPDVSSAFGRHAHWGYWDDPDRADGSAADFERAAERMAHLMADSIRIGPQTRVLDCGCGMGGTLASIHDRFKPSGLTGLNIDIRQLARARQSVIPTEASAGLTQATAIELPFADGSFDAVLAVECIFHFPDRQAFFTEVNRVLRPGGRLAVTDFVLPGRPVAALPAVPGLLDLVVRQVYGQIHPVTDGEYRSFADRAGLERTMTLDINAQTMPTFDTLPRVVTRVPGRSRLVSLVPSKLIEWAQRSGAARYTLLTFEKPDPASGRSSGG